MREKIILKWFGIEEAVPHRTRPFCKQWKDWVVLKRQPDYRVGDACVNDTLNSFPERSQIERRMQAKQRFLYRCGKFFATRSQSTVSVTPLEMARVRLEPPLASLDLGRGTTCPRLRFAVGVSDWTHLRFRGGKWLRGHKLRDWTKRDVHEN